MQVQARSGGLKSPFPGTDPYLQSHWGDIHHSLIAYGRETLQAVVPRDLRARVEERVFLEATAGFGRRVIPDVRVVEHRPATAPVPATASAVAIAEPLTIVLADEPTTQGYIEIPPTSGPHPLRVTALPRSPTGCRPLPR